MTVSAVASEIEPGAQTALVPYEPKEESPSEQIKNAQTEFEVLLKSVHTLEGLEQINADIEEQIEEWDENFTESEFAEVTAFEDALKNLYETRKQELSQIEGSPQQAVSQVEGAQKVAEKAIKELVTEATRAQGKTSTVTVNLQANIGSLTINYTNCTGDHAASSSKETSTPTISFPKLPVLPHISLPKLPTLPSLKLPSCSSIASSLFRKIVPVTPVLFFHAMQGYTTGGTSLGVALLQTAKLLTFPSAARTLASFILPKSLQPKLLPVVEYGTQAAIILKPFPSEGLHALANHEFSHLSTRDRLDLLRFPVALLTFRLSQLGSRKTVKTD